MKLGRYDSYVFDCDGVLLDSNRIKTEAFRELALPFGADVADQLVRYHQAFGGVSRFAKIRHLVRDILKHASPEPVETDLLTRFGELVVSKINRCATLPGVETLLDSLPDKSNRFVVSGGLQCEVQGTLAARGLASRFDGIYGSPRPKEVIFSELRESGALGRAVFFGDAVYDAEMADRFSMDFVFVYGVSEVDGWQEKIKPAMAVESLASVEIA